MSSYSITSLYSGSKGNCVLIESEKAKILIDAGKSARALCSALNSIGRSIDEIDAIFITHEHTDHISALEVLLRKHRIPVHMVRISAERVIDNKLAEHKHLVVMHDPLFKERVGDMRIESFPTSHDSAYSVGYVIRMLGKGVKIGYATDTGYVTDEMYDALTNCESVVIECNHDPSKLMNGPYPYDLKMRIISDTGHLSNFDCAYLLKDLCLFETKNILLAHLSEENNDPALAYDTVWEKINNESINLKVASQYEAVKLV